MNISKKIISSNSNIYDYDIYSLIYEVKKNSQKIINEGCNKFCLKGNNTNICGKGDLCDNFIRKQNILSILDRYYEQEFKDSIY